MFPQYSGGYSLGAPVDPAATAGMVLWVDERTFAPKDGAWATTIEKNAGGAKAYSEIICVSRRAPEPSRYFGQAWPSNRPLLGALNGWRCPIFSHNNTGSAGTFLQEIDYNVATTNIGTAAAYLPPNLQGYTAFVWKKLPVLANLVDGQEYWSLAVSGGTWLIKILPQYAAGVLVNLYAYILHQGAVAGTVSPFVDLLAGGFAAPGDFLSFAPYWNGTTVQMDVMRLDGTVVSTSSIAVDGLGATQVNAYRLVLGGKDGTASWDGAILAWGICQRNMTQTDRRALMQKLLTKYSTPTTQTWPDGPAPVDPATQNPAWGPGPFTVAAGLVSDVADATGGGHNFAAAGAQRPAATTIGTMPALTTSATQWLDQAVGVETDIVLNWHQFTRYVVESAKCDDNTPIGVQGAPGTLAGPSGLASGIIYTRGTGDSFGPSGFALCTGGPHAGEEFPTITAAFRSVAVKSTVVAALLLDPSIPIGGYGCFRATTGGEMQSDGGLDVAPNAAGPMTMGKRGTSHFVGDFVPDWVFPVAHSYKLQQQIRRFLSIAAGLVV